MPETGPGQTPEVLGPQLALEAVDDFMEEVPDEAERLPYVSLSSLINELEDLGKELYEIIPQEEIQKMYELQSRKDTLTVEEWNELMGLKASAEEKMRAWIEEKKKEDEAKKTREGESKDKAEDGLIDPEPTPQPDPNKPEPVPEPDPDPQPDPSNPDDPNNPGTDEPNEPPQEPPIRQEDRVEAHKMAENMVRAMEEEERNRLIERALDRSGLFGAIFLRQRRINEVDAQRQYRVSSELRDTIEEYCLQLVIGRQITESGNQVFDMMRRFNGGNWFDIDPNTGRFENPMHADSNTGLWSQLQRSVGLNRDNSRIRSTGPIAGAALAAGARTGLAHALGGFLGAIGGGAVAGGLSGYFRGRRESTEATNSAVSWLSEINAALKSGEEAEIELACHKVERIFREDATRNQFFNERTRYEAIQLLDRYREGMRRLAMHRMAREAADIPPNATETERRQAVASLYAQYCEEMSGMEEETLVINDQQVVHRRRIADEGKFQREHTQYAGAFAQELGIITARPGSGFDAAAQPPGARREVLIGFNRDTRIRRDNRSRIRRGYVIRGAVMGAAAGGIGYYIGGLIHGAIQGPEVHPVDTSEIAGGELYNQTHAEFAARSQHWGHFLNQNNMAEQGFTVDRAHELGFDRLINSEHCPFTPFGDEIYVGTDQGAALREAVLSWHNDLNLHGMDLDHVANLMNFAGSRADSLPVDVGLGYDLSQEQVQGIIDVIARDGDQSIFKANEILANFGLEHAHDYLAEEMAKEAAEEAARQRIWPGWLYLAGGAMLGTGYAIDVNRRNANVSETERQASRSPISPPPDAPYRAMGYDIKDFYRTPEPEPDDEEEEGEDSDDNEEEETEEEQTNEEENGENEEEEGEDTEQEDEEEETLNSAIEFRENQISEIQSEIQRLQGSQEQDLRGLDDWRIRNKLKVSARGINPPLFETDQMMELLENLTLSGGMEPGPIDTRTFSAGLEAEIRQARIEKGLSSSEVANIILSHRIEEDIRVDNNLRSVFSRDEIDDIKQGSRRLPTLQFRKTIRQRLKQWDEDKTESVANAWNALRARSRISSLETRRSQVEQELQDLRDQLDELQNN